MQVIGFFGNVISQFGALWTWVNQPLEVFENLGLENVSILSLLSLGLVGLLGIALTLHIIHLVNPLG